MTREEAIRILEEERDVYIPKWIKDIKLDFFDRRWVNALELAIKALKQESCEDCVSRQAVLDYIRDNYRRWFINDDAFMQCMNGIKDIMISVNPQPKTGHWILADEQNKEDVENDNYCFICSECQCSDIHAKGTKVSYCWNCGAKMESEE